MGTEAPGIFLPYHSVRMQNGINKHMYKKRIMQKIDQDYPLFRKAAIKAEDTNSAISKMFGLCPVQGQAAELYAKQVYCS